MTRNLKAPGLVLCAAFVLSAIGASAASAVVQDEFETDAPPGVQWHLTAKQKTDGNTKNIHGELLKGVQESQYTTGDEKTLKCNEVLAKATPVGPKNKSITTTSVEYNNCGAWRTNLEGKTEKVATTFIEFTSCDYNFSGETTETVNGPVGTNAAENHANYEIKCTTAGDHIHTKATELKLKCVTIPAQTVLHAVRYFNTGEDVSIHITAHGTKSTTENSLACPTPEGKTVVHETAANGGTYTGEITVEGYKDAAHTETTKVQIPGGPSTP
jgi:hypothetical protein